MRPSLEIGRYMDPESHTGLLGDLARISTDVYGDLRGFQVRSAAQHTPYFQDTLQLRDDVILLASTAGSRPQSQHIELVTGSDWLHFQFRLSGSGSEQCIDGARWDVPEGSCLISRYAEGAEIERIAEATDSWKVACLWMQPSAILDFLDITPDCFPPEASWMFAPGSSQGHAKLIQMNARVIATANEILRCTFAGVSRRIFMAAKATELLVHLFEDTWWNAQTLRGEAGDLTKRHYDRVAQARLYIESNIDASVTLGALARECGLNRTDLAVGFKRAFGTTVQRYWRRLRLERSRFHMLNDGISAAEASVIAGYAEQASFTRAFYKEFGDLPRACRV